MPKRLEKVRAADVRRHVAAVAGAEILRRLAIDHRHELRVQVGEMQQRDVAEIVEPEKLVLRQPLLRHGARKRAQPAHGRRGGCTDLKRFAAGDHGLLAYHLPRRPDAKRHKLNA